ncbi:hypothetical protein QYF36_025236 [Acer negundo]|nr:hypothetical protein QYF36_025236 [Acer negundo]
MVVALNFDLTTKINELMKEKESLLKEFADFSQEVEELKDEFVQCMQLMRAEIEQWDKALEIMKNKKLDNIERLTRAEQEIKRGHIRPWCYDYIMKCKRKIHRSNWVTKLWMRRDELKAIECSGTIRLKKSGDEDVVILSP